jgi:hypothetical protein
MKKYCMKRLSVSTCVLGLAMVLASSPASAAPSEHLNWGHQLNATETACPSGKPILNVSYRIMNSLDSGTGLNDFGAVWWAMQDYVLQVQVVQTGASAFCARVKTQGNIESVGGDGPGCLEQANCGSSSGRLEPDVIGTFQGGYTENFTGTFSPAGKRTNGSVGTFDRNCDPASPNGDCSGPGVAGWLNDYFTGVSGFDFDEWWGWVYHAGNNGSWVNKIDGNQGNITGQ